MCGATGLRRRRRNCRMASCHRSLADPLRGIASAAGIFEIDALINQRKFNRFALSELEKSRWVPLLSVRRSPLSEWFPTDF